MYLLNKLRFILANDQILLNKQQELVRRYHHDKISFLKALVSNSFKNYAPYMVKWDAYQEIGNFRRVFWSFSESFDNYELESGREFPYD